jgi:PhnB protein
MYIPPGFHTITPYFFVERADAFVQFLVDAFGGVETHRSLRPDGRVANAMVRVGDVTVMVSECSEAYPAMPGSYYLYVEDADTATARAIACGATLLMAVADQPYGDRQAGVRDAHGNIWWISQRLAQGPYAEDPGVEARTARTSRVIAASPAAIWDAFRDPARLARWWGPEGFTNEFESFEFCVGGDWRFVMRGPDGAAYPNHNRFDALDEPSRLVIRHVNAPHFTLTVTLAAEGDGTRLDWRQEFESVELHDQVIAIVEPANEQNLDRLEAQLGQMS